MKSFLFTFNLIWPIKIITDFLDSRREVLNWYLPLQNSIIIASEYDANYLSGLIASRFPGMFFLLTELDSQKTNGWNLERAWNFILNPKSSGRWN